MGRAVPLRDANDEVIKWFGACTDIHDQKLAQQAQAQLVAMRDDLVANVSHALRTPLASLRGFSELLLTREFPVMKQREFYSIINRESNRLSELINNFLDLQRMESGKQAFNFAPVNLIGLVQERAAFFAAGDLEHQVRLEMPVSLPLVRADAGRIQEVFNNLISNAFKYSPAGGDVVIGGHSSNGEVVLWVADNGIGIPAHAMPHLFQKFYRVESSEGRAISGTGLGLATVKQIVELHEGRVWAESSYGEGSTFYVALPCQTVPASTGVQQHPGNRPGEVVSDIVIVEDDKAFANLLCEHFHGLGVAVRHTAFAEEALEWCQAAPPRVLLLDIHLAGAMDGWDLLVTIKNDERLQKIRIVVMLGSDDNMHGLALAGADYILKSASRESLLSAVQGQITSITGKRFLVAGDDAISCGRIAAILREEGAEVAEASSGHETLQKLAEQLPDLLILELLMTHMDGFEVLRRLRNDRRAVNLRILVVASRDLRLKEKAYLRRGLATLVGKSEEDLNHFCEVIVRTLEETGRQVVQATGIGTVP